LLGRHFLTPAQAGVHKTATATATATTTGTPYMKMTIMTDNDNGKDNGLLTPQFQNYP